MFSINTFHCIQWLKGEPKFLWENYIQIIETYYVYPEKIRAIKMHVISRLSMFFVRYIFSSCSLCVKCTNALSCIFCPVFSHSTHPLLPEAKRWDCLTVHWSFIYVSCDFFFKWRTAKVQISPRWSHKRLETFLSTVVLNYFDLKTALTHLCLYLFPVPSVLAFASGNICAMSY